VLRFFRINDPYRLLAVLLLLIGLALPLLLHPLPVMITEMQDRVLGVSMQEGRSLYLELVDDTPWLAASLSALTQSVLGDSQTGRHIMALLLIFFQAAYFSSVLIRNRAYNESNYLPALVFTILCFFSFDVLSFSRELLASSFLLLALNNLFREIEFKVQQEETILNLGFFLGLASLIVFSFACFWLGTLLILVVFARLTLRKSLLLTFGFVLPHLALICVYFLRGGLPQLMEYFYAPNLTLQTTPLISWRSIFWLGSGVLVFFCFSIVMLNREARFTKYQSQLLQVMLLWLSIAVLEVVFTRVRTPHSFIPFIPPLTYFISHYLLLIRRKWLAETMLWIFLISTVALSSTARWGKLKAVDYSTLFLGANPEPSVQNRRVMVLGDGLTSYQNNTPASYFLNWQLSEPIFKNPGYYENLIRINASFEKCLPDVIIDRTHVMPDVFKYLPRWRNRYEAAGAVYTLRRPD